MLLTINTNSGYVSRANGVTNISIAKPIIEIVNLTTNTPLEINSEAKEISFEVKNTNTNNETSDVVLMYKLQVTANGMPIDYKIYKVNGVQRTLVNVINGVSEEFEMAHSVVQTDAYVMVVKLEDKNYQGMQEDISVSIIARQAIGGE